MSTVDNVLVSISIDQALAELREIAARLEAMPGDDAQRVALEARRDALREAAQAAADLARSPVALRRELEMLERRLRELEGRKIKRSLMERRTWVNDPSAYSHAINDLIAEGNADEREVIEQRLGLLRERLAELGDQAD